MLNKVRLEEVLVPYKQNFVQKWWPNERFKWEAVKCFQDNWDVNAPNFLEMLKCSFARSSNLLTSANFFPYGMIQDFAAEVPDEVRAMFIKLFDEDLDLYERITHFKEQSIRLLKEKGNGSKSHFQNENSITTYLWLRYPDKYYIFKFGLLKDVADALESSYLFKRGAFADNIRNHLKFYDEISEVLRQDTELVNLLQSQLTDDCYPDPQLRTLTIDVGFYISRVYPNVVPPKDEWWPIDYSPNLSVEDWVSLLRNPEIFFDRDLEIMKRMQDIGGQATCKQLANKYGETYHFYNRGSVSLAERIADHTGCPTRSEDNVIAKWWPILYMGKDADKNDEGSFIWRLHDELAEALTRIDLSEVKLYAEPKNGGELLPSVPIEPKDPYTKEDFLAEVFMTKERYDRLVSVLLNKKNLILQGAPGVGKTFAAKRLACSIMGERDDDRIEFIQFHQNYSYEDFVMGYKPVEDGFILKDGIFKLFCEKAANDPDRDYFFIIDEINRGNLSKIFGELLMLIERNYRGTEATLAYNGERFMVPERLHIIGMMNTADRSLAMIDYALRRRFSFITMEPGFDSSGFGKYQERLDNETFRDLILRVKELNQEITLDKSLGKGFCIGHSYFCEAREYADIDEWLKEIVLFDILPMLSEYWFDDSTKLERWENILNGVFQ